MIYFIILISSLFVIYFITRLLKVRNNDKIFLNISFFLLFVFLAIRSEKTGTDLSNYKAFFYYSNSMSILTLINSLEPGYAVYSFLIYHLTNGNFQILLALTAFISLLGPYVFIKDNSKNYFISIIAYICLNYYIFTFSGLRQSIALSITLLSIGCIKDKQLLKFLFFNLLAFSFHKSSIVFVLAYFLGTLNLKKKNIHILFILLIGIYFLRFNIMIVFTKLMYDNYSTFESPNGGYNLLMCYILFFILITIYKEKICKLDENNNIFYNMFYIGIIFQILSTTEGNGYRATLYFVIPLIVMITSLSNCFNKKSKQIFNMTIISLLLFYFAIGINNSSLVSNYNFFWS